MNVPLHSHSACSANYVFTLLLLPGYFAAIANPVKPGTNQKIIPNQFISNKGGMAEDPSRE
jgi:hypothetical protein